MFCGLVRRQVLLGQSDFATWLPSASPSFGGERSPWLFAEAYILVERTPQPLPQNLNLLYTFDLLTWVGFYSTFVLVSVVACGLSQLGMPELPPKVERPTHEKSTKAKNIFCSRNFTCTSL